MATSSNRRGLIKESELRQECREFLSLFRQAVQQDHLRDIQAPAWQDVLVRSKRSGATLALKLNWPKICSMCRASCREKSASTCSRST
ncbi:RsbRD N-terminal domain-containing protein [Microcoleus sp. FACHB-1515]|uniref:RsbRD N-terminal domain-containing protein n=1 Tax=Microcoleus sp. FACHB-1515 TaxID=2692821 RepID=UPI0037C9283D